MHWFLSTIHSADEAIREIFTRLCHQQLKVLWFHTMLTSSLVPSTLATKGYPFFFFFLTGYTLRTKGDADLTKAFLGHTIMGLAWCTVRLIERRCCGNLSISSVFPRCSRVLEPLFEASRSVIHLLLGNRDTQSIPTGRRIWYAGKGGQSWSNGIRGEFPDGISLNKEMLTILAFVLCKDSDTHHKQVCLTYFEPDITTTI
jgi:hypothetical protein